MAEIEVFGSGFIVFYEGDELYFPTYDEALDFVKSLEGYAKFDKNSDTAKVIYRQLNRRIKRVNDLTDQINELMNDLDRKIHRRVIVTNAIKRKQEMSKEDK